MKRLPLCTIFVGMLVGLALCLPTWSQRRQRATVEELEEDIYNEVVDERPQEERLSPAERLEKVGEQLRAIQEQKLREAAEAARSREAAPAEAPPAEPRRSRKESPSLPEAGTTVAGTAVKEPAELENRPTFGIEPPWTEIFVDREAEFQVRLDNPNQIPYDMAAFAIQYDPAVLEILDQSGSLPGVNIQDASAASLGLDINPTNRYYRNEVDGSKGLICFRASVPAGHSATNKAGVVARFKARGLRERGTSTLQFVQVVKGSEANEWLKKDLREPVTFLRMLDADDRERVLDSPVLNFGARLRILGTQDGDFAHSEDGIFQTALRLEPSESQVRVGQEFDVVIRLDNPDRVPFDAVALYLRYDSRVLRVIDTDDNNWIAQGVNIHDGPYQEDFSFEYCKANRVDLERGEIVYAMESFSEPCTAEGPFARIRFQAIRPVPATYLLYGFNVPGKFPTTGLFRHQRDVLAKT
ncbi:MAG TPA: hypothetical protein ENN74_04020, partial [Firmicutes bacterium]|nr:hypothetical protein [Bacillota bacterium]